MFAEVDHSHIGLRVRSTRSPIGFNRVIYGVNDRRLVVERVILVPMYMGWGVDK